MSSSPSLWARYRTLRRERRWVRWLEDGAFLVLVLSAVFAWQTRNHVASGEPLPAFSFADLEGKTWRSEDLRGKPVVLHLWAPWCGVCKQETGTFSRLHESLGDDAHVVSVALSYRSVSDVQRFVRDYGAKYPVLLGDDQFQEALRVDSFPTTYVLTPDGRISSSAVGLVTTAGLRMRLWRAKL